MDGYYDTAQICLNGHCITSMALSSPEFKKDYCILCGAKTITTCQNCNKDILGYYHSKYAVPYTYIVPKYCHNCGKPYPWTVTAIQAATELIALDDMFSAEETQILVDALPDLIAETPKTQLAVAKFKKLLSAAGKFTIDGIRQFAIDFGCAYAKSELSKLGL